VQQERGRKLAPRQCCRPCEAWLRPSMRSMASPLYAQHSSAPLCAAWLRHDAKMLVTPRAPDAIWGMAADKTLRCVGRRRLHPFDQAKGPTRPAPRLIPSGSKRREALPVASPS